jgi:hypothetical protein
MTIRRTHDICHVRYDVGPRALDGQPAHGIGNKN